MQPWNHTLAAFILSGGTRYTEQEFLAHYEVDTLEKVQAVQQKEFMQVPDMYSLYTTIDLPVSHIVLAMHEYGVHLDVAMLQETRKTLVEKRATFAQRIRDRLGNINPSSPKQIGDALSTICKVSLKKTATGQYSTTNYELTQLAPTFPVAQDILDYRAVDKVITTYVDALLDKVDASNCIHPVYDLTSAATGRLASSNPNIQSTPVGPPYGDMIRACFTARPEMVLIGFDYSQQELRILAHLSHDPKLSDAFHTGIDVHEATASWVLKIPEGQVDAAARSIGKTLNFGIIYGETPYGLARQLGKPVAECAHILKSYYEAYSGIKRYYDNLLTSAKMHGSATTMCGRRRGIPGLPYGKPTKYLRPDQERVLKNFPIQGSAADMTKKAMVSVAQDVLPRYADAHLVMQIHDELIFEFPTKSTKRDAFIKDVEQAMKHALPLDVPVVVDHKVGKNWAQLK
ncbi:MAG TPA: DNA polymerase [Candidatus Woesebacteria bacterium]|nr:DNA polymerase [Candidatus Woesebacteria bacterium]HNS95099.1 DNA polymerase [Candidatus Woesebacteria bacterium]